MRMLIALYAAATVGLTGCVGPVALHQAVLGYDESISRIEREMLLVNIARIHRNLPGHFTVTSSVAATFDYRTSAGVVGNFLAGPLNNSSSVAFAASAGENPTFSIVPVQGEEFTKRILTPMDESRFEFLVFQGAPIDMVLRLMADGIEVRSRDGVFERFVLNSPVRPDEYEEFRRRVLHLAWLNEQRKLFVSTLSVEERIPVALPAPPSAGDFVSALQQGYRWRPLGDGRYELSRWQPGRVVITNYDPRTLAPGERRTLNAWAASNPANFVLTDVRPDHPGGDYPLFGAFKLRSLNVLLGFVAAGIERHPEYAVAADRRTLAVARNPVRALAIDLPDTMQAQGDTTTAALGGRHYAVGDSDWDREAFTLVYQLFQMTVTDVSRVGVPSITIAK